MIGVVFIATAWGRNNGGINSINAALIKQLSSIIGQDKDWRLFCVVTQKDENSDTVDEIWASYNVVLISTNKPVTSSRLRKELTSLDFSQLFFVGHDVITGNYANQLRDRYAPKATSIIFHHMDYRQYYYLRGRNPSKIREKELSQKDILPKADIIISIGPSLYDSACDLRKDARREEVTKIHAITPGLENIEPITGRHNSHTVILFGRIEDENNAVKQIELAVDAIGKYLSDNPAENIIIKCFGYADDSPINQKKLMKEISDIAKKVIPITANSYIQNEDELFRELASASLCIMPSIYEGFGLTGYEAIAAGVPVIISENTGLFKFLDNWSGESIRGLFKTVNVRGGSQENGKEYRPEDLNSLSMSIHDIFSNYDKHKDNAIKLRQILIDGYCTWDYAARAFAQIIEAELGFEEARLPRRNNQHINEKTHIGLKEYIVNYLLPEFCSSFCNTDTLICKVIKYSNEGHRRFTVFSSHEFNKAADNQLRIRDINDGTVGILNQVYEQEGQINFPIVISDFTSSRCYLISHVDRIEVIEDQNIGVPDHQVLAIIAVPLIYDGNLVGALTFDVFDQEFVSNLDVNNKTFMTNIYSNMRHFSYLLAIQLYSNIRDDLEFNGVQKMLTKRELVSFSGRCPLNCKHCFTKEIVSENETENDISDIINQLSDKVFDVVYVSHYKENFFDPNKGVALCEKIFEAYHCDICVTTRCVLTGGPLARIKQLNKKMKENGNNLSFCISIPALESFEKIEDVDIIATPNQRIDFAGQLKGLGIASFVTIRPLFPANFISTSEIHRIVDECAGKVNGILTGGLSATDSILVDLQIARDSITYLGKTESEYLIGVNMGKDFFAVDVNEEIQDLEVYCKGKNIPFFKHSMEALNYFKV